ncbi:hypothetical protein QE152_g18918 [Popillia japonica]|uniref:Uncharacterized protein n=1 Tax=Popillia japonica TaxID=7064 RepID=A0AAW1KZ74_POPJA
MKETLEINYHRWASGVYPEVVLVHIDSRSRSKKVLEIIHSDVCGPITPNTYDGEKYFVTFIDDFSKEKSEFEKVCSLFDQRKKKGVINLVFIESQNQQADILTKGLPVCNFTKFRTLLGLRDFSEGGC